MRVRSATVADVPAMHRIRRAVRENRLSDTTAIDESTYLPFLAQGGGWVAETSEGVIGFAVVDVQAASVWALFTDPKAEGLGAGRALHERLLEWSRSQGLRSLFLTTSAGTRAERFYRRQGWQDAGCSDDGELRFERLL
jgi:GNAT superfamily N-acetyltransferase